MSEAFGVNSDRSKTCVAFAGLTSGMEARRSFDATPMPLGIETADDVFAQMIPRNTPLPCHHSQVFTTATNFQTKVDINILQGDSDTASGNQSIGKFRLEGIRRAFRGIPQIEVTFEIDTSGVVHVSAKDLKTQKMQSITLL